MPLASNHNVICIKSHRKVMQMTVLFDANGMLSWCKMGNKMPKMPISSLSNCETKSVLRLDFFYLVSFQQLFFQPIILTFSLYNQLPNKLHFHVKNTRMKPFLGEKKNWNKAQRKPKMGGNIGFWKKETRPRMRCNKTRKSNQNAPDFHSNYAVE